MNSKVFSNADSFKKLLSEIREKYPLVEDIYYSTHTGTWSVKYSDPNPHGDSDHETFDGLMAELSELFNVPA